MATITHSQHTHEHHHPLAPQKTPRFDILLPLRQWVDRFEVRDRKLAHVICQVIPCCCPFERTLHLFGKTYHIPPLCKLNPLYDEFVYLRFRALDYLTAVCHEDVTKYIC